MKTANLRSLIVLICLAAGLPFHASAGSSSAADTGVETCRQLKHNDLVAPKVLSLQMAKCLAVQNNPSQSEAAERVQQAAQRVHQATSAYYPTVDAAMSWTRTNQAENLAVSNPDDAYQANLSLTWILFDGFKRDYSLDSAREDKQQFMKAEENSRRLLLGNVSLGYYNAQYYQEALGISAANQAFQLQQLVHAEARNKAGAGSISEVLNFRIQVNSAQSDRIRAEQNYRVALIGLTNLLGARETDFLDKVSLTPLARDEEMEAALPDLNDLITKALKLRPDLKQYTHSLSKIEASLGLARASLYPTISVTGAVTGNRYDDTGFESDDFGSSFGLNISMNLFSGGRTGREIAELQSKHHEIQFQYQNAQLTVKADLAKALAELKSNQQLAALQQGTQDLVKQNRNQVQAEYLAGRASYTELNEAQNELVKAQAGLIQAMVSLKKAWEALHTTTAENLGQEL